jgi:hypothetical protein
VGVLPGAEVGDEPEAGVVGVAVLDLRGSATSAHPREKEM